MALPRADIREQRRAARKPPKAPSAMGLAGPGANFGATVNQFGQVQAGSRPSPLAAQGSQFGQQAAMDALNNIRGFTSGGFTAADRAMIGQQQNAANLQSQAAIQSLAQQAAARGMGGAGMTQVMQAQAAQSGANQAAQNAAQYGLGAQQRAMGATQALFGMGQGLDTQAMQRGGALDAFNQWQTGTQMGAQQQDYQNQLARWQAEQAQRQARMQAITGGLQSLGSFGLGAASLARQG